jgi:hypothetical protein
MDLAVSLQYGLKNLAVWLQQAQPALLFFSLCYHARFFA